MRYLFLVLMVLGCVGMSSSATAQTTVPWGSCVSDIDSDTLFIMMDDGRGTLTNINANLAPTHEAYPIGPAYEKFVLKGISWTVSGGFWKLKFDTRREQNAYRIDKITCYTNDNYAFACVLNKVETPCEIY